MNSSGSNTLESKIYVGGWKNRLIWSCWLGPLLIFLQHKNPGRGIFNQNILRGQAPYHDEKIRPILQDECEVCSFWQIVI
jgi:hypothetical protein